MRASRNKTKRIVVAATLLAGVSGVWWSAHHFAFEKPSWANVGEKSRSAPRAAETASGVPDFVSVERLDQLHVFEGESLKILRSFSHVRSPSDRERLVAQLSALEAMRDRQLADKAASLGVPMTLRRADGELSALAGFEGNRPRYMSPNNADAAIATGASFVRQNANFDPVLGPRIDGAGLGAGVFELGAVYSHAEFELPDGTSRVVTLTDAEPTGHGSHVGGTIGAKGLVPAAKGMAPAVTIYSWYQESAAKYASQAIPYPGSGNMVVTNTSLGTDGSGRYTSADQSRDDWARLFPYTIMFQCAGNAGSAFETLNGTTKEAKNHFTVGNVVDVTRNSSGVKTGGGGIVSGSSRGPTDDGRIKPDIVANGNGVYSIGMTAGSYGTRSGTSMSTPNATGSAVLLQDYFSKRFPGHLLRSDTLKGLVIHTADDGGNAGPDYIYGHGLMNVHAAARIIKAYADQPSGRQLSHEILNQGATHMRTLTYSGSGPIRVTLAWLDPTGPASRYDDDRLPALVNDLDVTVTAPSGTVHRPWTMPYVLNGFNAADRGTPAVRGDNTVDNAEVVLIDAPSEAGAYTITVKHKGVLSGGAQPYSLIHSGFATPASAPPPVLASWTDQGGGWFELSGSGFMLGARVVVAQNGVEIASGQGMQVAGSRIVCRLDSTPPAGATFGVVNPDGQASSSEFEPPKGAGIILSANEATWTYSQTFDTLTRDSAADATWEDDPGEDGVAGLKGWYAGYYQADGSRVALAPAIRADSGTSGTGRLYSYGASSSATDRALGSMRQNALMEIGGSVRMGLKLVNRTGRTLTGFSLAFHGEQWRRSSNAAAQYIQAAYAIFPEGEGALAAAGGVYTDIARFDTLKAGSYSGNLNGNDASNRTLSSVTIDNLAWAPGQELWVRWLTPNFPDYDAGLAIDDVVFTARWSPPLTPFASYARAHGLAGDEADPWAVLHADGVPNVLKFALGIAPHNPNASVAMPAIGMARENGRSYVTLNLSLGNEMAWDGEGGAFTGGGLTMWIEQSTDLVEWAPSAMQPVIAMGEAVTLPAATSIDFRQEIANAGETPRLFFRLRIELEP